MAANVKSRRAEYIAIGIALALGAMSIALGAYDPFWNLLGISSEIRGPLTIAVSLFTLLSGFLIAYYLQQAAVLAQQTRTKKATINELSQALRAIPQTRSLSCYNGDEALKIISENIEEAEVVLNTKITSGVYQDIPSSLRKWNTSLKGAIRSGTVFREVVSETWKSATQDRANDLEDADGLYEAHAIPFDLPAFMNFIVLTYRDGSQEVWFGWIMSPGHSFDQPCACCREDRVVQLFKHWHSALSAAGEAITSTSPVAPTPENIHSDAT